MYRLGWDERNSSNISHLLNTEEVVEYPDLNSVVRTIPLGFNTTSIIGKIFIVTGTGKYFKKVDGDPENNLTVSVSQKTVGLPNFCGATRTAANLPLNSQRT